MFDSISRSDRLIREDRIRRSTVILHGNKIQTVIRRPNNIGTNIIQIMKRGELKGASESAASLQSAPLNPTGCLPPSSVQSEGVSPHPSCSNQGGDGKTAVAPQTSELPSTISVSRLVVKAASLEAEVARLRGSLSAAQVCGSQCHPFHLIGIDLQIERLLTGH